MNKKKLEEKTLIEEIKKQFAIFNSGLWVTKRIR